MTGTVPTTSPSVRRRPKDRKDAIVNAAAALFAERGFAGVAIDEIGAAVGVTGPAIYRHYRGKEALLVAVLARTADDVLAAMTDARADGGGLEAIVEATVEVGVSQPALFRAYARERASLVGEVPEGLRDPERRMTELWREAIDEACPGLDRPRLRMRRQAVIGAVGTAAVGGRGVEPARVAALATDAAVAAATARPRADGPERVEIGWTPAATRRSEILRVALGLFEQRGFNGVGIDEIGEAAGISGPSIYRYYDGKIDLLVDTYDQAGERVLVGVDEAIRKATSARDALARLAWSYAEVALDSGALLTVTEREGGFVPTEHRARLRKRGRDIRDGWAAVVRELRPELAEAEVRTLVRMVFPVVNQAARAVRGRQELANDLAGIAEAFVSGGRNK